MADELEQIRMHIYMLERWLRNTLGVDPPGWPKDGSPPMTKPDESFCFCPPSVCGGARYPHQICRVEAVRAEKAKSVPPAEPDPSSWARLLIARDPCQGPRVLERMIKWYEENDGRADDFGRLFIVVEAQDALDEHRAHDVGTSEP